MNTPYVERINHDNVWVNGIATNEDAKLYWIGVPTTRTDYDAAHSISSTRIRYLASEFDYKRDEWGMRNRTMASLDSYCTVQSYISDLSLKCSGQSMPLSSSESVATRFYNMFAIPSGEQIKNGLDMNNYKAPVSGVETIAVRPLIYLSLNIFTEGCVSTGQNHRA